MKFVHASIYFALWLLTIIGNTIYVFGKIGLTIYSIFLLIHPSVSLLCLLLAFKMGIHTFERGTSHAPDLSKSRISLIMMDLSDESEDSDSGPEIENLNLDIKKKMQSYCEKKKEGEEDIN